MTAEPNLFAYVMLCAWPVAAAILYATRPASVATIWTFLGAFMLLPAVVTIKIPMVPQFDKSSIPALCALAGCVVVLGRRLRLFRGLGFLGLVIVAFVLSPIATSLLNGDTIVVGSSVLPGVGLYDGISAAIAQAIQIIPLLLARRLFNQPAETERLFRALVVSAMAYSVLLLFEVRFSPQLHNWVYGFHSSSFAQAMRFGGFRPMAFMGHGLIASFFIMTSVIAAAALARLGKAVPRSPQGVGETYLGAVLVLCKSVAALMFAVLAWPLVRFASLKTQLRIAILLALVSVSYPLTRTADLFPVKALLDVSAALSPDRAQSLEFRFTQEDTLLKKALERPWFGWGRFGRGRVFDDEGIDRSVTDGYWIITMGQFGIIGYFAAFTLLAWPIVLAARLARRARGTDRYTLGALSMIAALTLLNQIPNASLNPWAWLMLGALLGRAEALKSARRTVIVRQPAAPAVPATAPASMNPFAPSRLP